MLNMSRPCIAAAVLLCACSPASDAHSPPERQIMQYPVQVAPVGSQNVEYSLRAVGSVQAYERVSITSRVEGVTERVLFTEGDRVKRGQVLVEIEVERYILAVQSAQATLERAQAAQAEAVAALKRRDSDKVQSLGIIPREEMQQWRTRVQTLGAEVRQAEVALQQARLDLRDARVRAPEDGVVQTRDVQTGQFVTKGVQLASLLRRDPLLVRFDIPETEATRLRPDMMVRFRVRDSHQEYQAAVIHVAAEVDEASRMVTITARVDDPNQASLNPGAFAEVVVPIASKAAAPVVPQTAVRSTERGFLAYTVDKEKQVVQERRLHLGLRTDDGQVEIRDGLSPGEDLVIRGVEALRDGAPIRVVAPAKAKVELGQAEP